MTNESTRMLNIRDLRIDPTSLGEKKLLVDIMPAYEHKNQQGTETITGYRYIVALPEHALEKIGVKIEGKLSVIARQGRAFSIHLILATQRPDATIISGQIRSNLDCRIYGRADQVLSQIVFDAVASHERISKIAQGRFTTNDGVLFQGFWLDSL